jgi:release factor glutamine methyltransferase
MLSTALQSHEISAIDTLRSAVLALQQARIETASLDARLLLQHVLGVEYGQWLSGSVGTLTSRQYETYLGLIEKRKNRQPLAQLVGKREFWDWVFTVTPATLDPRPDSETLIEAVLEKFRDLRANLRVLDLGTGTGCLLLTLLKLFPNASGVGVDISDAALNVARKNGDALGLTQRVQWVNSCWAEGVEGIFDIVISNPPYIPTQTIATLAPEVRDFEPMLALDGGADGLSCYRAIIPQLQRLLAPEGLAVLEIGIGQEKDVTEMVVNSQLAVNKVRPDLAGIPRCILIEQGKQ